MAGGAAAHCTVECHFRQLRLRSCVARHPQRWRLLCALGKSVCERAGRCKAYKMTLEIAILYWQRCMLQRTAIRRRRGRSREKDLAGRILGALVFNASELVFDQTSGARGEVGTYEIVVHARMVHSVLACARLFVCLISDHSKPARRDEWIAYICLTMEGLVQAHTSKHVGGYSTSITERARH